MNLHEIKKLEQEKHTVLFNECGLFWAFSDKQFAENKTPLKEGEKYVSIGGGGYLPKGNVDKFTDGMKSISKWFKETVKNNKLRREQIIYELSNHEAWYTYELEDTLAALGSDFTKEEVLKVFNEEVEKQSTY
jgi:hypothetical protein